MLKMKIFKMFQVLLIVLQFVPLGEPLKSFMWNLTMVFPYKRGPQANNHLKNLVSKSVIMHKYEVIKVLLLLAVVELGMGSMETPRVASCLGWQGAPAKKKR